VPSYFFHPRRLPVEQQNAAVAMSYYTCAPLAWTAAVFVVAGLGAVLASLVEAVGLAFFLLAALLPFALLAVWWLDLIHVAHRTLRRRAIALVSFAVAVPVLWLVVAALILVGIPLAFFLVALVVSSLS
jgi:hypothetical protein